MGVTGLWTVLQPCARPIKIETLNKKRLAVDASIWIYQFLKAVRDKEGNALRNSHIVGFFRRVCKLLFIGIKPVFVFDGGAPALKRQTISNRKSRREGRREDAVRTAGKLLAIQMQRAAEEEEKKRKEAARHPRNQDEQEALPENLVYAEEILQSQQERAENRKFKKKDQYHLPDLGKSMNEMGGADDPRVMSLEELEEYARQFDRGEDINVYDFSKIDFEGHFFQSLPAADRYNILNAARLRSRLRMGYSKEQLDTMFPDRMAFSKFQIERVRERNELTQRLMNLNGMNDDMVGVGGANRVAGEKGREYVLVKNDGVEGGWALGVVTNRDEGKAHKPIDVDLPPPPVEEDDEWEEDEDFEDVPIEGLNRLPKAKPGLSEQDKEGREFISNELAKRRRRFYNSRKQRPAQPRPRKASPVNQDPDSLFLAEDNVDEEWENMPTTHEDGLFEDIGDDVEDEQLQQAIALSMQSNGENEPTGEAVEAEDDPVREVFQQKRAADANPFAGVKGRGLAIARLANQRSSKLAIKGPFEGSDSEEDEINLHTALAESRKSKRPFNPQQASPKSLVKAAAPAIKPTSKSTNAPGFDGPLPFERLNLGNSILGKKKMERIEAETAGGFEKTLSQDKKDAAPLPPWFSEKRDLDEDLNAQRQEGKQQWEEAKEEEKSRFQFQQLPRIHKKEMDEIIDLDAPSQASNKQIIAIDSDEEDALMEDAPVVDTELRMGDLADKVRAEPPKPLSPQQRSPPRQDLTLTTKTPFAEGSDDEPVDWSESDAENEKGPQATERSTEADRELPRGPSKSPSEEFEDVPMNESAAEEELLEVPLLPTDDVLMSRPVPAPQPTKSPSPEFEDVPIRIEAASRPRRRNRSPSPAQLQGPDDLEIPIVPHSGVADDPTLLDLPGNESDQYSDPEDADLFASLAAEAEEHERFAKEVTNNNATRVNFDEELKSLRAQQKKDRRDADEVTQSMITECQHLLTMFGLPYITAPMEAEAQCAELVHLGLVDGIVTDDSDTFLFGGTRVYKNMFNAAKFVECYLANDLVSEFSLTREKMIAIAQLLGSDYTTGIPGIGPVTALELLAEFPDLQDFKDWWTGVQNNTIPKDADRGSAFRRRFRRSQATKLFLPPGFPDQRVADAYLHPEVDSDPEQFQWGVPDLAALRTFLSSQIGWSWERTDEVLVPVIRDMNRREKEGTQANITRFFEGSVGAGAFAPRVRNGGANSGPSGKKKGKAAAGKRLGAALSKLAEREGARGGIDENNDDADAEVSEGLLGAVEDNPASTNELATRKKRKGGSKTTSVTAEDDFAATEDDEDDEAYEEPKKKKLRKTRKVKAAT
jgi:DNA excision repair protein ERCC-5